MMTRSITETREILSVELQRMISAEVAWRLRVIPHKKSGAKLVLQTDQDISDLALRDELELLIGCPVDLVPLSTVQLQRGLATYYQITSRSNRRIDLATQDADSLIHDLLTEARELGSSDIHIEAQDSGSRIRIRVDGILVERYHFDRTEHQSLINKLKVKARLDIAEKRLPQDGRLLVGSGGDRIDVRVSVLPTLHGEKIVLRILGNDASSITLESLGMDEWELSEYRRGAQRPNGLVLISGPTGSGKTTTLYATLRELNEVRRNILTIEDPIEYTLEGINQVQLREEIGLGFPQALRTFLRQDPDVIMVGEIRDSETAQMAIRAALTGHLVLSTIHTNSAWGTISRLLDMGIPPFLLASSLTTSVAQRLIRRLCPKCKQAAQPHTGESQVQFEAVGCEHCNYTGYRGRVALYEVITMDDDLALSIREGQHDVRNILRKKGVRTISQCAARAIAKGITSVTEAAPLMLERTESQ